MDRQYYRKPKVHRQISDKDFMQWKPVLIRIKRAHEYLKANEGNEELEKAAYKRFDEVIIPECEKVGIPTHFAAGLFVFGKEFLEREFGARGLK